MAEPPAAVAVDAAASDRDLLLATKLHVPATRSDLVSRPRLAKPLDGGWGLVLVCAPAGYGKTVLLAEWASLGRRPVAWLSLDAGDNDPARFWRHAVAALDRILSGIGERLTSLLGPPAPLSYDGLVTALVNELVATPGTDEITLILDDYHVINSHPVHASLEFLLEHRPPGLQVLISSRADPPMALARLRARGQLAELRAAELRFTADEAAELLRQVVAEPGRPLPPAAVAALAARTEGWAAGLQLAALSLRGQPDVDGFVAAFTGTHRYILDYLAGEVLERQSEQVRTFLLETSVLERLSGPLCDAVTGRTGSQALLEEVERAGLFLLPLDEVRGWWRYHHLFADLLRARLEHRPDRVAELHRTAASWYEQRGLADDAIHHTLAAGETAWAARLVEEHFDTVFNLRGEEATIRSWLPAIPENLVQSRPRLLLAQAQMAAMRGDVDAMEPLIDAADRVSDTADDEEFEPSTGRAGSLLVNVPAVIALQRSYMAQLRGDPEGTAAYTAQALAELDDGEDMLRSAVQGFLAVSEWMRGRLAEAEQAFGSSLTGWRAAGQVTTTAWGNYLRARIQRAQGRLDASIQTCRQALESTALPGRRPLPAAGPAYVGLAEVAYQRNDLDEALANATEGIAVCRQFVHTPPLAAGLVTLAWIRNATGDRAGAIDAIGEAERLAPGPAGLLNPVPAQRARLLLAQGDLTGAAQWIEDAGLAADDELDYSREMGRLVLARVLLAQDRPEPALALLDRMLADAVSQDRRGSIIELHTLRALALAATGDEPAARIALAAALDVAGPQGHIRVFTDEGPKMAALITRTTPPQATGDPLAEIPIDYLTRVRRSFDMGSAAPPGSSGSAPTPGLVEQLTDRELEVLAIMAAGRANRAIARQLVVSVDTVKKHVSHVLAKLGATNRTEAVARARDLGLIP